jgi:hypothetical protein
MMTIKKVLISAALLAASGSAWAWSANYLDGQNWAITCANGTSHSYHGSSAGLDTVGPELCPGGIANPDEPQPGPVWTVDNIEKFKPDASPEGSHKKKAAQRLKAAQ